MGSNAPDIMCLESRLIQILRTSIFDLQIPICSYRWVGLWQKCRSIRQRTFGLDNFWRQRAQPFSRWVHKILVKAPIALSVAHMQEILKYKNFN